MSIWLPSSSLYFNFCIIWLADPRSKVLALEVNLPMQDHRISWKCSSCLDFALLKKCVHPDCPHALCYKKTNLHPYVKDLDPEDFLYSPCWICHCKNLLPVTIICKLFIRESQDFLWPRCVNNSTPWLHKVPISPTFSTLAVGGGILTLQTFDVWCFS